jgi:tyrosine-protein phosphatase SIW14
MHRPNSRRVSILSGTFALLLLFSSLGAWSSSKKSNEDLPNFAQVSDTLYRGGQPSYAGFQALQHMGIGIVVNFREEPGETAIEKRDVESMGMKYVGIPWSGRENPSNAQIAQFLDLVRVNPQTKVFVHCLRGADRTGTMVASYRIAVQHQPVEQAVSEMRRFHYDHFWLPQLQRYVIAFPNQLKSNAMFSAYAPAPANPIAAAAETAVATVAAPAVR